MVGLPRRIEGGDYQDFFTEEPATQSKQSDMDLQTCSSLPMSPEPSDLYLRGVLLKRNHSYALVDYMFVTILN